jgi:hypothetical protein
MDAEIPELNGGFHHRDKSGGFSLSHGFLEDIPTKKMEDKHFFALVDTANSQLQ